MKKALSLLLALLSIVMMIPVAVSAAETDAPPMDEEGYYLLDSVEDLMWFNVLVNGEPPFRMSEVDVYANAKLTADIVFSEDDFVNMYYGHWEGLGLYEGDLNSVEYAYKGTFDGQGHTISGLYASSSPNAYAGFFGVTAGATIKNLGLIDVTVNGAHSAGGLVGCATADAGGKATTIENCYVTGSVIIEERSAGGLAGYAKNVNIKNSYVRATVSAQICGGIAGDIGDAAISGCYYDSSLCSSGDAAQAKTPEQFASGEVAVLLNGNVVDGTQAWYQTVGEGAPAYQGDTVYQAMLDETTTYTNGGGQYPVVKKGVFQIETADHLRVFANYVDSGFQSANAKLLNDIDMDGYLWDTPLGREQYYLGTLDGNYKTIFNLNQNTNSDAQKTGLFFTLGQTGVIKNLALDHALIDVVDNLQSFGDTGTFVHYSEGLIAGCKLVNSTVISRGNYDDVGGITGNCLDQGKVVDCAVINSTITLTGESGKIGGIVPVLSGGTVSNCYVYNCKFEGGTDSKNGVITGQSEDDQVNCYYYCEGDFTETRAAFKTPEQFASGEVAYLLNGGVTDGSQFWYQTVGEGLPDFDGKTVYCNDGVYTNSANSVIGGEQDTKPDTDDKTSPGTGDAESVVFYALALSLAVFAIAVMVFGKRKTRACA